MKILIINTLYHPNITGGAERSVQFLAESLHRAGNDVTVVSISMTDRDHISIQNGVKVYYLKHRNFFNRFSSNHYKTWQYLCWHLLDSLNPFLASIVDKIIRVEKPDIINTHNISGFSPAVWLTARRRGCPLVHTIRDYYLLCPHASMFRNNGNCKEICLKCKFFSFFKKLLSRYVNAVIGISDFVLDRHIRFGYFPNSKMQKVIYNSYERPTSKLPKKIKNNRLTFGFLGRLHPKKGIELFLNSLSRLDPDNTFAVIGGQGSQGYLEQLQNKYPTQNVRFEGWIHTDQFFDSVDVLVVPSLWHEPLGRVVIEAFSHGIPVIASKRGGLQELIDEGKTGMLFDPDLEKDLAEKFAFFQKHPARQKEMSRNAASKAASFSHANMVHGYLNSYQSVLTALPESV